VLPASETLSVSLPADGASLKTSSTRKCCLAFVVPVYYWKILVTVPNLVVSEIIDTKKAIKATMHIPLVNHVNYLKLPCLVAKWVPLSPIPGTFVKQLFA
jgi:hypothetical protein